MINEILHYNSKFNNDIESYSSVKTPILNALQSYIQNPSVQLHIPGHTRGNAILPKFKEIVGEKAIFIDTTDEFDNLGTLHPATGPIKESQELMAQLFGAKKSYFLLNGSTIGNIALAITCSKDNQKVIVGRNSHRSIVTGIIMSGATPVWITPEKMPEWGIWGGIAPENVEQLLEENPDTAMVWVTSPTYEGIVSDIKSIAKICKKYSVPLIVDEAHGCLWKFNDKLPTPAIELGADAVVHSLHKTGGSFCQSSVLHIAPNSNIDTLELEANLKLLHTTSPSYTLLASIDAARAHLESKKGQVLIEQAVQNAYYVREQLSKLPQVKCLSNDIDPTKIYIMVDGLSGKRLENILEVEYHIEIESAVDNGILILSNIGNSQKDLEYFCECISSITKSDYHDISHLEKTKYMPLLKPIIKMTPRQAFYMDKKLVTPKQAVGRIAAEVIAECPPGISVMIPGELITDEHLPYLVNYEFVKVLK